MFMCELTSVKTPLERCRRSNAIGSAQKLQLHTVKRSPPFSYTTANLRKDCMHELRLQALVVLFPR